MRGGREEGERGSIEHLHSLFPGPCSGLGLTFTTTSLVDSTIFETAGRDLMLSITDTTYAGSESSLALEVFYA